MSQIVIAIEPATNNLSFERNEHCLLEGGGLQSVTARVADFHRVLEHSVSGCTHSILLRHLVTGRSCRECFCKGDVPIDIRKCAYRH
ncbi:hypothetical protein VTO42DRAFT_1542 [Malbranchea cinnamomea]